MLKAKLLATIPKTTALNQSEEETAGGASRLRTYHFTPSSLLLQEHDFATLVTVLRVRKRKILALLAITSHKIVPSCRETGEEGVQISQCM